MDRIELWIKGLLVDAGIAPNMLPGLLLFISVLGMALLAILSFWITKKLIINSLYRLFRRTTATWDDMLIEFKVFHHVAHLTPAIIIRLLAPLIFRDFAYWLPLVIKLTDVYLILVGFRIFLSFLRVIEYSLSRSPVFIDKPLASYFQLIRIVLYIAAGILLLSILLGRSPLYFLSAFGAMTAIILLIFKDTILGLVASVQISANDMVRVGDWVEMPKFNADGDVIAINLNTVKVRNWDKTVTTIPTYYFITDSFKNWRGMQESGGRRIKRALYIHVRTIRFVDPEMRERYSKYGLIGDYIRGRQQEIEQFNISHHIDTSELINGRRMTNIGVFRKYVEAYLRNNPAINQEMTLIVRQLAMEDRGVPIEIYCFTRSTAWVDYEAAQADIFDHLLAAAAFFGLEIFQQPAGSDITTAFARQQAAS